MADALILRAPAALSAPGAAPTVLHPLPVAGAIRRFAAMSIAQAFGSEVASWADLAGSGNPLTQATAGARPTLVDDGGAAVRLDGVDDWLGGVFTTATPLTIITFAKMRALPPASNVYHQYSSFSTGSVGSMSADSSGRHYSYGATSGVQSAAAAIAADTYNTIAAVFNGADSLNIVNGTAVAGNLGAPAVATLRVGRISGAGAGTYPNFAALNVKEMVIYPRALSAAEVESVRQTLITAYV